MSDTPEQIAAKLTEAQRGFVLWLPGDGSWVRTTEGDFNRWGVNGLRGFGQSGLIDSEYGRFNMQHRLSPLGLQVRAILQGDQP